MLDYYVKCNKANICKLASWQCNHHKIHPHYGENSVCFKVFKCPQIQEECYCIPVSDEEIIDSKKKK